MQNSKGSAAESLFFVACKQLRITLTTVAHAIFIRLTTSIISHTDTRAMVSAVAAENISSPIYEDVT